MGLNLPWVVDEDGLWVTADVAGYRLTAAGWGEWRVKWRKGEVEGKAPLLGSGRLTIVGAQEAAEAAAARMLAEDAGVRALMGLADLRERAESAEECSAQYLREWNAIVAAAGSRTHGAAVGHVAAMRARVAELEASLRWIPVTEGLPRLGQRVVLLRQTGTPFQHARVVSLCSEGGQTPAWWDDCYGGISGGPGDVWMEIPGYTAGPEVGQ